MQPDRERRFLNPERVLSEREICNEALEVYRHWHAVLGEHRDIIDFDLREKPERGEQILAEMFQRAPTRIQLSSHVEIVGRLLEQVKKSKPVSSENSHIWDFLEAQVEASYWYAKKKAGYKIDTFEYIEMTQTFEPEFIPESLLQALSQRLVTQAEEITGSSDPAVMEKWRKANCLSSDGAKELFGEKALQAAKRIRHFTGLYFDHDFDVEAVDVNEYWWVWANTDPDTGRFLFRQNFSEERDKIWTPGKAEELGWHEGFHGARMARRKELIRRGKLHPFFGLNTVHGPGGAVDEGLGQTLVYFVPGIYQSLSPEGKLRVDESVLRSMVYGNIHLRINDPRESLSPGQITRYIRTHIPWEPRKIIDRESKDRTSDPLLQTYRYAYALGVRMMLTYAENLNDRGKQEFLRNIFERPYTLPQVNNLFNRLITKKRNIASNIPKGQIPDADGENVQENSFLTQNIA